MVLARSSGSQFEDGSTVFLAIDCEAETFSITVDDGDPQMSFTCTRAYGKGEPFRVAVTVCGFSRLQLIATGGTNLQP